MAMIKCSECGQNISDKAAVCIGCGAPIATTLQALETERTKIAEKDTDDNISLKQLIDEDINNAWRTEDEASLGALKMLRAAIKQRETDEHNELSDADVANIIEIMIKEQCNSIPKFEDIGRQDLADTERLRMNLLNTYLQPNIRKSGLAPASSNKCIATADDVDRWKERAEAGRIQDQKRENNLNLNTKGKLNWLVFVFATLIVALIFSFFKAPSPRMSQAEFEEMGRKTNESIHKFNKQIIQQDEERRIQEEALRREVRRDMGR